MPPVGVAPGAGGPLRRPYSTTHGVWIRLGTTRESSPTLPARGAAPSEEPGDGGEVYSRNASNTAKRFSPTATTLDGCLVLRALDCKSYGLVQLNQDWKGKQGSIMRETAAIRPFSALFFRAATRKNPASNGLLFSKWRRESEWKSRFLTAF